MSEIKWLFPPNEGGRESGLNDPGLETFSGNFTHYLARELIQNSFDAREDPTKPVTVKFDLQKLNRSQVPHMDGLTAALSACAEYWDENPKSQKFFNESEELSKSNRISALIIGDYNTKGVRGTDSDRKQDWYNLIRCAGSSVKGSGSGGSFGIGKNAPFAASLLRTVLYSTLNVDGEYIFQGVSTLATFELSTDKMAQATGYLGINGTSVREKALIPARYLRKEKGTDIIVLGYRGGDNWQNDLLFSVLDNFWLAIHWGELIVKVGTINVDKNNLEELLKQFRTHENFTGYLYYAAYTQGVVTNGELKNLQDVEMHLMEGDEEMPKRVSLMRNTGMTIEHRRFRSLRPFCGVFVCKNDVGSDKLRQMEPPKHDKWDCDHPDKGANKIIENEFSSFIRECIKALSPADNSKVISVPGLHQYLPDDDDSPEEPFDGDGNEGKGESADAIYEPKKIEGHVLKPSQGLKQPNIDSLDNNKPGEGGDSMEFPGGDGEQDGGDGATDNPDESEDGGNGGGGSDNDDSKKDKEESKNKGGFSSGGLTSNPSVPLNARTFCTDVNAGAYTFLLKGEFAKPKKAKIVVYAVGDDQRNPVIILSAVDEAGTTVSVDSSGIVGPVDLIQSKPLRLNIVLKQPGRIAMEVAAYEVE